MRKKKRKKISLKRHLGLWLGTIYFVLFGIIIVWLFLSVIAYYSEKEYLVQEKIEKADSAITSDIEQITKFVTQIYLSEDEFHDLKKQADGIENYNNLYTIQKNMDLWMDMNTGIDGIFVYYNQGNDVVYKLGRFITLEEKQQLMQNNQRLLSSVRNEIGQTIQQLENEAYFTAYCISDGVSILAITSIGENMDRLIDYQPWKLVGIEQNGLIYGSSELQQEWRYSNIEMKENERKIINSFVIYYHKIPEQNLGMVIMIKNNLWNYVSPAHILMLVLLFASVYPAYRVYYLLQRQFLKPLEELTNNMRILQTGKWNININDNTYIEEIDNVNQTFAVMIREIENLKIQTYEEKNQRQYAQLQYLQLQLNPHFYMNCLKLIQARIGMGDTDHVEDFLIQLSFHFRYLMKKGMNLVTVEQEMKFVYNYLNLIRELYTGKIKECIYVDPEILEMHIPILAIQTFVENSVKYARKQDQKELMIQISVKYMNVGEGEFLILTVRDDGIGFPDEVLKVLNAVKEEQKCGIGISNLKRRIQMIYAQDYSWYFCNQEGALSELVLPCIHNDKDKS